MIFIRKFEFPIIETITWVAEEIALSFEFLLLLEIDSCKYKGLVKEIIIIEIYVKLYILFYLAQSLNSKSYARLLADCLLFGIKKTSLIGNDTRKDICLCDGLQCDGLQSG